MDAETTAEVAPSSAEKRAKAELQPTGRAGEGGGHPPQGKGRRYQYVYVPALAAIVAIALAMLRLPGLALECGAIAFFLAYLIQAAIKLPRASKDQLRENADQSDVPGYVILVVALATLATAAGSLFMLINSGHQVDRLHLGLGIGAMVLGWLAIHSMMGFHYAYEYYETDESSPRGHDGRKAHIGGLDFPGKEPPDGLSTLR